MRCDVLVAGAVITSVLGVFCLARTLFAIEWAASRVPLPEFSVHYEDQRNILECRAKEQKVICIDVTNTGEEIAENVEIFVGFPPVFNLPKKKGQEYNIVEQGSYTAHRDLIAAIFEIDRIHINITQSLTIEVEMPEITGSYKIPVGVYERKAGESEHMLVLKIVS